MRGRAWPALLLFSSTRGSPATWQSRSRISGNLPMTRRHFSYIRTASSRQASMAHARHAPSPDQGHGRDPYHLSNVSFSLPLPGRCAILASCDLLSEPPLPSPSTGRTAIVPVTWKRRSDTTGNAAQNTRPGASCHTSVPALVSVALAPLAAPLGPLLERTRSISSSAARIRDSDR